MHDFLSGLPESVVEEFSRQSTQRTFAEGESVYRKGEPSEYVYRIGSGAIKLCNYSPDGDEIISGEFRQGDCFGEMGVIDGLPRVSHAIASQPCKLQVLTKQKFQQLCKQYPQISHQINIVLCRRVRFLYSLNEEAVGLKLHQRLARVLQRLAYSHGEVERLGGVCITISHENISKMLGASRQSVSKELKQLERDGDIELLYGKIRIVQLARLTEKYETAIGIEQLTSVY